MGILFIAITNIFNVWRPEFVGDSIDKLSSWETKGDGSDLLLEALKLGGIYMAIALASGLFLFLTRQMIIIMSRHIEFDLKNEIYTHYQKLDYSFYKRNSTGDLMNRISEDVTKVRMYLGPGIMYTINLVILFVFAIYNMLQISAVLTFIVLLPLPIMSYIIYKVSSKINRISVSVQEEQSYMSTLVQESFSGIRVMKAYDRIGEMNDRLNKSSDVYKNRNMRLVLVNSLFMPTIFILIGISTILCIYLGGHYFYAGSITVGEIMKFLIYVNMLTWPFASVGWVISINQRAAASQARINEFLRTKPSITNTVNTPFVFNGKIEFRNVSYRYPNSNVTAVKNLSFKIEKGEVLGIVGRTGSGKSTILSLLMRQIEPDSGEILIDGVALNNINLNDLKNQTGVVPQDVFLFSDSIRNNIAFGTSKLVDDEQLKDITEIAHVYHNIIAFEHGFDTLLGERGVNLSGGQKQRISIARALIRKPQLLLLDDCLSAVDTETEEVILRNLDRLKINSSIIVSHRISSIRNANTILVIDHGELLESGTHASLIQKDGIYANMYKQQLLEEKNQTTFED